MGERGERCSEGRRPSGRRGRAGTAEGRRPAGGGGKDLPAGTRSGLRSPSALSAHASCSRSRRLLPGREEQDEERGTTLPTRGGCLSGAGLFSPICRTLCSSKPRYLLVSGTPLRP